MLFLAKERLSRRDVILFIRLMNKERLTLARKSQFLTGL